MYFYLNNTVNIHMKDSLSLSPLSSLSQYHCLSLILVNCQIKIKSKLIYQHRTLKLSFKIKKNSRVFFVQQDAGLEISVVVVRGIQKQVSLYWICFVTIL